LGKEGWRGGFSSSVRGVACLFLSERERLFGLVAAGVLGLAGLEAVLELSRDLLLVPHAAGTGGLSALELLAPVVLADLSGRVAARRALSLLDVQRATAASSAQGVRLVVTLTEAGGTLGHFGGGGWA
jgi:hypothetical protein